MQTTLLEIIVESFLIFSEIKISNKIDKIILIKKNKFQNFKIIDKTPIINQIQKNKKSNITKKQKIEILVSKFLNRLSIYITEEEMKIAKSNLRTLQYKEGGLLFLLQPNWGGYYNPKKHYTAVSKSKKIDEATFEHIIFHELLHAVTSYHTKNNYYMGFYQLNKNIGKMINEGYTELLNSNMFGGNEQTGYKYEVAIAELIEFIVGKEKMKKLYFNHDLDGLINELSKYQDINKVKQFILDLDTIHSLYRETKDNHARKILLNLYNKTSIFLYEAFCRKTEQTTNINNLVNYEYESKRFLKLFEETTKHNALMIETQIQKEKKEEKTKTQYIESSKRYIRKNSKKRGFINILTIITLLTFLFILSIEVSYLILQVR